MARAKPRTVADLIRVHEGVRPKVYRDTRGVLTIGVGRNLRDVGLSADEIDILFRNDIERATGAARRYHWFSELSEVRQAVIIDMIFQLGSAGVRKFRRMRAALAAGAYGEAALEMLDSTWARDQTPRRARQLARMMRRNVWPR